MDETIYTCYSCGMDCLPLVNTTSTKTQATGHYWWKVWVLDAFYKSPSTASCESTNAQMRSTRNTLTATNCDDGVKVAWKGGNPLLHQIALLWNNQLKWLCVWQFSNCGPMGWVEIHMTFHHIYTLYTIGQWQNECTKVFGKYKFIIQDLWTHLCNMKQLASFPGYPLTPTKIKNGTSFPGPLSLFLRRAWERDYSQNGFVTLHNP